MHDINKKQIHSLNNFFDVSQMYQNMFGGGDGGNIIRVSKEVNVV